MGVKLFFTFFLLIANAIAAIQAYDRTKLYNTNASYQIRVKGQMLCYDEPHSTSELSYRWFAWWGKEDEIVKGYPNKNGFFDFSVNYNKEIKESKNPYLYIKNDCWMYGSYRWNWYYFEDYMVCDVDAGEDQYVDFGKLDLYNTRFTYNKQLYLEQDVVVTSPKKSG